MLDSQIYLKQIEVGPMENFAYLIGDRKKREAMIVDPAWQVDTLLKIANEEDIKITGALISHHHYDHTNGIADLLTRHDIPIYIHAEDAPYLKGIRTNLVTTRHGQEITIGDLRLKMLHTPGHTPGSQCFHVEDYLISGDTLFIGGCGRCDLPGGDPEKMYYTLTQKLMSLKDETILLPGHNYAQEPQSTLETEKRQNPYLRMASLSLKDFLRLRMGK